MNTLYICRGLPGSGKTFWARQFVSDRGFRATRVNRDDLRQMAHNGQYSPEREFFILRAAETMIAQALMAGYDVVSDDTNLQNYITKKLFSVAAICGRRVEWVMFETPIDVCIARDRKRQNPVGEHVIRDMNAMIQPIPIDQIVPSTIVYPGDEYHDPQISRQSIT